MIKVYFVIILFLMAAFLVGMLYYLSGKVGRLLELHGIKIERKYTALSLSIITVMLFIWKSAFVGILVHMILLFVICDIVKAVLKMFEKEGRVYRFAKKVYANGMLVVWLSLLLTIYAAYNAKNTVLTEYSVTIDKVMEQDLKIIMISDIHAGTSVQKKELDNMLSIVNQEQADVICLCGDVFDEGSGEEIITYAFEKFSEMESKYGIYYVKGNHDASLCEKYESQFEQAGITILEDETVLVADWFYLVGRLDEIEGERKDLDKLLESVDETKPIIVLDHRPEKLAQVKQSAADLQLSGHTHAGQIIPGNLLVPLANDMCYGYAKYKDVNIIVSSGMGTWGLPIRTAEHSEIVKVILQGAT